MCHSIGCWRNRGFCSNQDSEFRREEWSDFLLSLRLCRLRSCSKEFCLRFKRLSLWREGAAFAVRLSRKNQLNGEREGVVT